MSLSKTQIDRLGDRLRAGSREVSDLEALNRYRLWFRAAYDSVVETIRGKLRLKPTGRPAKSTTSIIEKLRRESIRLSQMQDIAGCRMVVAGVAEQDRAVGLLRDEFADASVTDRRERPSHGYRAVHVVVQALGRPVEVQVRTALQDLWAELSENLADRIDPAVKYGEGPDEIRRMLSRFAVVVARVEQQERAVFWDALIAYAREGSVDGVAGKRREVDALAEELAGFIRATIKELKTKKGDPE